MHVAAWSEHARHYILTSDVDAALISENHRGREKLVTAAKEARKSSWAGTGRAAIDTANNGTRAGVLALVRTPCFSKHLSTCTDEARVLKEILLLTAYFEHSVGFRSDSQCQYHA